MRGSASFAGGRAHLWKMGREEVAEARKRHCQTNLNRPVEMIMDRGVDGGKLLQCLYVPELRHRTLSSSERLM